MIRSSARSYNGNLRQGLGPEHKQIAAGPGGPAASRWSTDKVKLGWFDILRVVRVRLLNLPEHLAPFLAAEPDPRCGREMLQVEIRTVLADAADRVAKLVR